MGITKDEKKGKNGIENYYTSDPDNTLNIQNPIVINVSFGKKSVKR